MKILNISDTHSKHRKIPDAWLVNADMIICAGDISTYGYVNEIIDFLDWFSKLNYKYKIFILGNHDWLGQDNPQKFREILSQYPDIIYLENDYVEIEGIKIYGTPVTPFFFNWAFNVDRGPDILEYWNRIPFDTHILITHGPVYSILDTTPDGRSVGCVDLYNTINERLLGLKLFISGHIHCSSGYEVINDVQYVNAAILNERYEVQYRPRVVEVNL